MDDGCAEVGLRCVPELENQWKAAEDCVHRPSLNPDTPPMNKSYAAEALLSCTTDIFFDD